LPLTLPNSAASTKATVPYPSTTIVVTSSYSRHYSVASRSTQQPVSTSMVQRSLQVRVAVSSRPSVAQSGIAHQCHRKHPSTVASPKLAITIPSIRFNCTTLSHVFHQTCTKVFLDLTISKRLTGLSISIFHIFSGATIRRKRTWAFQQHIYTGREHKSGSRCALHLASYQTACYLSSIISCDTLRTAHTH